MLGKRIFLTFFSLANFFSTETMAQEGWTFKVKDHPVLHRPINQSTGLQMPSNWHEKANFLKSAYGNSPLPTKFDWREMAEGGLTPIRNQGNCGSCWAFATAATFADTLKIKENISADLSEQHLVSCNQDGYSCGGGYWAFDMYQKYGWVKEEEFPYRASDIACKNNLTYKDKITSSAFVDGGQNGRVPSVENMKRAILEHGPLLVGVAASQSFQGYSSGVYNACDSNDLNHAVNLVGWDDETGSWIMRNSWGADWGDKGYMKIKYNCNSIGEGASFVTYTPKCPIQPDANAGTEVTIRSGEKATIGGTPYYDNVYLWSSAPGMTEADRTNPNPDVSPTKSTVYTLKVTTKCGVAVSTVKVNVTQ